MSDFEWEEYVREQGRPIDKYSAEYGEWAEIQMARLGEVISRQEERLIEWEEKEASVCPEDVGFVDQIRSLEKRLLHINVISRGDRYDIS